MWPLCGVIAVDFGDCCLSGFTWLGLGLGDFAPKWLILGQIFWRPRYGSNSCVVQFWAKFSMGLLCGKDSAVDRSGPKNIWLHFPAWFLDLKRVVGDNFVVVNFQTSYFWLYALMATGDQVLVFRWSWGVWLGNLEQERRFGTLLGANGFCEIR